MINPIQDHPYLLLAVCAGFLIDWLAIACRWRKIKPITKAVALLGLILWTFNAVGWDVDYFAVMLLFAQSFGLAGDIFLLFPKRWFLGGLISFLIGHLFYISLIMILVIDRGRSTLSDGLLWRIIVCALTWLVFLFYFYFIFGPAFKKRNKSNLMWIAVQVYLWILSGLVALSLFLFLIYPSCLWISIILPIGALLFLISDILLATNRFIREFTLAQLWVRITYHLAQLCLAIGILSLK